MSQKITTTVNCYSYTNKMTEIPDEVLEKLGWSENTELLWTIQDGEVVIKKVGGISRAQVADAAWYLYRMLPAITGQRQSEVEKDLRSFTAQGIIEEAGHIQETFYKQDADEALKLWIGKITQND